MTATLVTETTNAGLKREFKVVVNAAELAKEAAIRLKDMAAKAQIKGFRPGKVPVDHLKRMYGKSVMAEVIQKTVDDQSRAVFADRNLKPAYQPEVKLPEAEAEVNAIMEGKSDLSFAVSAEVIPDFEIQGFSGLTLAKHVAPVTDAHIDEAVARLSSQSKNWESKADGAVSATGDRVTISFLGTIDGVAFDGGKADDIPLEIGSNQFIPGFEEQLTGVKAGDELTVKVNFPENYGAKNLAGKAAEFATKVSTIDSPKDAVIDDEFAKRMGFDDVGKLREIDRKSVV